MTHYIHRPTPEGGETDLRFRELTDAILATSGVDVLHRLGHWGQVLFADIAIGTIWRIPGSDAPSDQLLALAKATRETG